MHVCVTPSASAPADEALAEEQARRAQIVAEERARRQAEKDRKEEERRGATPV